MNGHSKVMVKVFDGKEIVWRHFSYIPTKLVFQFEDTGEKLSKAIAEWAKADVGVLIEDLRSLRLAKSKIKNLYKEKYPDMYLEGNTDSQGWVRLWVIEHIKEELKSE